MELTNFEIENSVTLRYAGQSLDLHNYYDFYEFKYSVFSQVFEMQWNKIEAEETTIYSINKLKLQFRAVSFLKILERDTEVPVSEDMCVDVIGYLPQNMREVMNTSGDKPDN